MLTTQVASQTRDVAFLINSSGFMMPLWKEMLYNREAQLKADGIPASEVTEAVEFQKLLFQVGRTGAGWNEIGRSKRGFKGANGSRKSLKRKRRASRRCAGDGRTSIGFDPRRSPERALSCARRVRRTRYLHSGSCCGRKYATNADRSR